MEEERLAQVVTTEDHLCGTCRKQINAGPDALMGEAAMLDRWERLIQVRVYYHNPECRPRTLRQTRKPRIDPSVAKKERGRRWRNR